MAEKVAYDLTARGLVARTFVFYVCYDHESVDRGLYHGPLFMDFYGRLIPPHTVATVHLLSPSASSSQIRELLARRFESDVPPQLLIRRLGIAAENVQSAQDLRQLDFFTDYETQEKERQLQETVLELRGKHGLNTILKGTDFVPGATGRERNQQIGGHQA